jgi:ParB family chromosome partitioning protein
MSADRKKSGESRNTRPNAPARKSCKKRVPPPSSASSRTPRPTFTAAQLRVLLRALVNLDPYTFTDDLVEEIAGENENEQRTAEEVLLSAIDGLQDDKLSGFALRFALIGHVAIPREGEFDFLAEAEAAFAPPQSKKTATKKAKATTPIKATQKTAAKKTTAKKQVAA